jgi:hypothetical protein
LTLAKDEKRNVSYPYMPRGGKCYLAALREFDSTFSQRVASLYVGGLANRSQERARVLHGPGSFLSVPIHLHCR